MDLGTFFTNALDKVQTWGSAFIMLIGAIMLIVAVVFLCVKFMTHGRGGQSMSWVMLVVMILIGGFLMVSGFQGVTKFADIGTATLESLGS